jgi:hypothetical protein
MSKEFPSWWTSPDGKQETFTAGPVGPKGWRRRKGYYDAENGVWVDEEPARKAKK